MNSVSKTSIPFFRASTRKVCLRAGFLLALGLLSAAGANWPNWRGPNGNGISPEKNLPTQWSETKNVRWRVALPDRGNSSPIVWGDRVFLTQAIEKEGRRSLMCFDRNDGKLLWQPGVTYTEKEDTHPTNPYCSASPVTDGERVVAAFGSAGLYCYDFQGKELWHRDLGKQSHQWGNASSPILHDDLCILYHGPGEQSFLIAVNKRTGKTVWQVDIPQVKPTQRKDNFAGQEPGVIGSWSTPMVIKVKGRDTLVLSLPEQLRAFDPATGKDFWAVSGLNPLIYTSPVWGEGLLVVMGGFFGTTLAVRPDGKVDAAKPEIVWPIDRAKKNRIGSGIITGGHLYVLNSDGIAECIELAGGKTVWEERLKGTGAKSESWSSAVLAGDKLYFVNQSGETHVVRASPQFELIASNSVGELSNSTLALSNGDIVLRTHKSLWCFSDVKKTASVK